MLSKSKNDLIKLSQLNLFIWQLWMCVCVHIRTRWSGLRLERSTVVSFQSACRDEIYSIPVQFIFSPLVCDLVDHGDFVSGQHHLQQLSHWSRTHHRMEWRTDLANQSLSRAQQCKSILSQLLCQKCGPIFFKGKVSLDTDFCCYTTQDQPIECTYVRHSPRLYPPPMFGRLQMWNWRESTSCVHLSNSKSGQFYDQWTVGDRIFQRVLRYFESNSTKFVLHGWSESGLLVRDSNRHTNERQYRKFGVEIISSLLNEYPLFQKYNGSNHLFFNFIGGRNGKVNLKLGSAILASAALDTFTYRPNFDLKLPVYNPKHEQYLQQTSLERHIKLTLEKRRNFGVVCIHCDVAKRHQNTLIEIQRKNLDQIVFYSRCNNFSTLDGPTITNHNRSEDVLCGSNSLVASYKEILSSFTFCLIFPSSHVVQQTLLSDALMYGCIPIILDDRFVDHFESKLDWKRFSVRMHEAQFSESMAIKLFDLRHSFPSGRLQAMRRNAVLVWAKHFSSIEAIVETSLYLLNERMFPQTVITKQKWNQLDLNFDPLKCFAFEVGFQQSDCFEENAFEDRWDLIDCRQMDGGQSKNSGFTAVILTYDRLESLIEVIAQVLTAPSLVKILIIWNHQQKKPPEKTDFLRMISSQTHKPLRVSIDIVLTIENRLSNRFYPFKEIETECVLSIDDDITMLNGDELEFGFQIWREFPDRIVGFPSRVHRYDNLTHRWKYDSEWTNEMSLILTGAAFYHKVTFFRRFFSVHLFNGFLIFPIVLSLPVHIRLVSHNSRLGRCAHELWRHCDEFSGFQRDQESAAQDHSSKKISLSWVHKSAYDFGRCRFSSQSTISLCQSFCCHLRKHSTSICRISGGPSSVQGQSSRKA